MRLSLVTVLVPDYEAGLRFFVDGLGWHLLSDQDQGRKRWVTVAPPQGKCDRAGSGTAILLAVPSGPTQGAALGAQTGGRVGFFLETRDFDGDAARISAAGGALLEAPRTEPYGKVAQWRDPWGNLWDLIEPAS